MFDRKDKRRLAKGFLILGKNGPTFDSFNVRFKIRRKTPTFCGLLLDGGPSDGCCRSVRCNDPPPAVAPSWPPPSSDGWLVLVHLGVLVIGAVDLCLDLRTSDATLHVILSASAAVLTTIYIALRVLFLRMMTSSSSSRGVAACVAGDLSLTPEANDSIVEFNRMQSVVRKSLTLIGMSAILTNVVLFPVFYLVLHLGWTVVSNNALIVLFDRLHDRLVGAVGRRTARSNEDCHRAVVFEAALLLRDQFSLRSPDARQVYESRTHSFLVALKNTPCYGSKPDYMTEGDPETSEPLFPGQENDSTEEHLSYI